MIVNLLQEEQEELKTPRKSAARLLRLYGRYVTVCLPAVRIPAAPPQSSGLARCESLLPGTNEVQNLAASDRIAPLPRARHIGRRAQHLPRVERPQRCRLRPY